VGEVKGDELEVDTWLMSCRVLKRQVEEEVLNEVVRLARLKGCRTVRGIYVPTAKNKMVRNPFDNLGFTVVLDEAEKREFVLDADSWKLYEEPFELVFSRSHRLANKEQVDVGDLVPERFLVRTHCENCGDVSDQLRLKGVGADRRHEVSSDQDLISLLELQVGVGMLPQTVSAPQTLLRTPIKGVDLQRAVYLYGVAGRQRSPIAGTFMKMLRAAAWPKPH